MKIIDFKAFEHVRKSIQQKQNKSSYKCIYVCCGTGCIGNDSQELVNEFQEQISKRKNKIDVSIEVKKTGCHGFCAAGPLVVLEPEKILYCGVKKEHVAMIIDKTLLRGEVLEPLLYKDPVTHKAVICYYDIPFFKKQTKIVLRNTGKIDPENIEESITEDGYSTFADVIKNKSPLDVIQEISKSQLRGRGGGGFLTGNKWLACRNIQSEKHILICNADEGDPGAFMDRSVMEGDPHSIIEGMLIGGYAMGAQEGYIYVREEYPLAVTRMKKAIQQATEYGFLGQNILSTDFSFSLFLVQGNGAFVCGEETGLMASIEGNPGEPRPRPPFPSEKGLWGYPTCINNVETWATVPSILNKGWQWFSSMGTTSSKGTKIFSLVGKINNTGLIEVPMGITLREIIYDIGGGIPNNRTFKAIQTGGPSGGCLPISLIDTPMDYETLKNVGSMMGSGGMIVMDDRTCMVDITRFFLHFLKEESCGKCLPCREGVTQLYWMVDAICKGKGSLNDLEKMERLANVIKKASLCGLGKTAPNPLLSTLKYFREEYTTHIVDKKCPAGVCKDLVSYVITDQCTGCTLCYKACPEGAIKGGKPKMKHEIIQPQCIRCGACFDVCPVQAIQIT